MKKFILILCVIATTGMIQSHALENKKNKRHLFILSGQSNMVGLNHDVHFSPIIEKEYGKENVRIFKVAVGAQPISRWYKNYQYPDKREITDRSKIGDLYDRLIQKVNQSVSGQKFDSITFIWMQGESDAQKGLGDVYANSFNGILNQLRQDLKEEEINFVIGRLSDYHQGKRRMEPKWNKIRDIQMALAENSIYGQWVNTDDLNDGKNHSGKDISNDLHYSVEGYKLLGKRFAEAAIELIKGSKGFSIDVSEFTSLKKYINSLNADDNLIKTIIKIEKLLDNKSTTEVEKKEAKKILLIYDSYVKKQYDELVKNINNHPLNGTEKIEEFFKTIKGTLTEKQIHEQFKEFKKSDAYKIKITIDKEFKKCQKKIEKKGTLTIKKINSIVKKLKTLTKKNPNLKISVLINSYIEKTLKSIE